MKHRVAFLLWFCATLASAQIPRSVIDTHGHVSTPGDSPDLPKAAELAIQVMDANGIRATVDLSGGSGEALRRKIAFYNQRYPGRFVVCVNIPWDKIDDPQFSKLALGLVEQGPRWSAPDRGCPVGVTESHRAVAGAPRIPPAAPG